MDTPWCPALHEAFLGHCHWTLQLCGKQNKQDYLEQLNKLAQKMKEPPPMEESIIRNQKKAQKQLHAMH